MNFIDQAEVNILAGSGGNGKVGFHHEKSISRGGPDGGDGGDGGDVILKASTNQNSLAVFRYNKRLRAESGQPGGTNRKHGKSGNDLIVAVPVGTEAKDENNKLVADLTQDGQTAIVAIGGKGGFGNAHFVSSSRQAPNFAEKGEPGASSIITLELKMLADVGLVGLPNAGKSTLLRALSNARPRVADYPFTTLNPSVGVVDINDNTSLLFADIPGLIEGAADGKGLGHDFLRHIERTSVIVHVIDAYVDNIVEAYTTIHNELAAYRKELIKRPQIIVINKTEGLDGEITSDLVNRLRAIIKPKTTPIFTISAKSGQGLREVVLAAKKAKDKVLAKQAPKDREQIYEYKLAETDQAWQVEKQEDNVFMVRGEQVERFAVRTDFTNDQAVARLIDILKKRGVMHALVRKGIRPGDRVFIADKGQFKY